MIQFKISSWANNISNDTIWLAEAYRNGLYKLMLEEKRIEFVTWFDELPMNKSNMFNELHVFGEEIVLMPCDVRCITVYNIVKNTTDYIWIDNAYKESFSRSAFFDNKIYFMSTNNRMLSFDVSEKTIKEESYYTQRILEDVKETDILQVFANEHVIIVKGKDDKAVLVINLKKQKVETIYVDGLINDVSMIYCANDNLWISYNGSQKISKLNIINKKIEHYPCKEEEWIVDTPIRSYSRMIFKDNIYLPNYNVKTPMKVDEEKHEVVKQFDEIRFINHNPQPQNPIMSNALVWEGKVVFVPQEGDEFVICGEDRVETIPAYVEYDDREFLKKTNLKGEMVTERNDLSMRAFVESIP